MDTELPKRKRTRLRNFDYSKNGFYFITICTNDRKSILSKITVGEGSPLPQKSVDLLLTKYGEAVNECIQKISKKFKAVSVDKYVIMPNHIHLLFSIQGNGGRGDPSPTVIALVAWLKYKSTSEINRLRLTNGEPVFQRSFHDHVIRNREDYVMIYKYINDNPKRWKEDCFYNE